MKIGTEVILKNNPNPVQVIFRIEEEYDDKFTLRPIHDFPLPDGGYISKNTTREAKLEEFEEVWVFQISSGYDGFRNKVTGDWIYTDDFYVKFFGREEIKTEKLYTKEDLEEAHKMGAIFAYGRKSATREERLEHFNNWINTK